MLEAIALPSGSSPARDTQLSDAYSEGVREGKKITLRDCEETERKSHRQRRADHALWFLVGIALMFVTGALLVADILPQLTKALWAGIGVASMFTFMHLKKWDFHRERSHRK
jgi:hypothetical protein